MGEAVEEAAGEVEEEAEEEVEEQQLQEQLQEEIRNSSEQNPLPSMGIDKTSIDSSQTSRDTCL